MEITPDIKARLRKAAESVPEHARAVTALEQIVEAARSKDVLAHLEEAARLFAASAYLINHCRRHPDDLVRAAREAGTEYGPKAIRKAAREEFADTDAAEVDETMTAIRGFKRRTILAITLRDLMGRADAMSIMRELSVLAECIMDHALKQALAIVDRRHGSPPSGGRLCLIGLGKLGGEEIN